MTPVLFVTNGHGEAAIAQRIALELHGLLPDAGLDHFALVGNRNVGELREVGPRRAMPSGGLIAMGNARNLIGDLRAGLLTLTLAQMAFLRRVRGKYGIVVAVGDVYALAMALLAGVRTVFVGTAKSVEVAQYGWFEARIVARAAAAFVRNDATARALRRYGVNAEAANAIVDLFATAGDCNVEPAIDGFMPALLLFPGSRESAYDNAGFLLEVTRALAAQRPQLGAVLSIAPGLDADRFAAGARRDGWYVAPSAYDAIPFVLSREQRPIVRAWRGALGPLLARASIVLGQAGTANEAAAAAGVPVVAFERDHGRNMRWYRQRQRGLLGDALAVFPDTLPDAVAGVSAILDDAAARERMGRIGRARMGPSGSTQRIAERVAAMVEKS